MTTFADILVRKSSQLLFPSIPSFPGNHLLFQPPPPPHHQQHVVPNNTTTIISDTKTMTNELPDWNFEILRLEIVLFLISIFWLMFVPRYYLLFRQYSKRSTDDDSTIPKQQRRRVRYRYYLFVLPVTILISIVGFSVTALCVIAMVSPYNTYIARRVFQTPILTMEECQRIIHTSNDVAMENVRRLQKYHPDDYSHKERLMLYEEPVGWQKLRHDHVPTTDLNVVTDPFPYDFQQWMIQLCNVRMAPLLSRMYGIPIRSIQARDIFVVRYDGNGTRTKLSKHTDSGDISFTIFLNHGFSGGGTQFWNRHTQTPFHLLQSHNVSGQLSTFPAVIEHEGYPTTAGQRLILVGFLDVVQYDEDGITSTGLSIFASWLNWNWLFPRLETYINKYDWQSRYWRKITKKILVKTVKLIDRLTKHEMTPPLIRQEQLPEMIQVLEQSYHRRDRNMNQPKKQARWLEGQQKKAFEQFINDYFDEGEEQEMDNDIVEATDMDGDDEGNEL